jgi:biopolymer transport protein ExbB
VYLLLCIGWIGALCLAAAGPAFAQSAEAADPEASRSADQAEADLPLDLPDRPKPKSLDELLGLVKHGFQEERVENHQREEEFKRAKDQQERLLAEALEKRERATALSERLETSYNENEALIGKLQARLTEQLGQMGELFGVVRQVANDLSGQVWESVTSSQLGSRKELLDRLGRSKDLPSTEDLERLWYELQREMTEQGKVVRYPAKVLMENGQQEEHEVIRVGVFSVLSDGKYLAWESRDQQLRELTRQPPGRHLDTVEPFEEATSGYAPLALDPSRGALLAALIETPSSTERIQQGGYVGYVIIVLGVFALFLGVLRWIAISITARKVAAQRKSDRADPGNPLGRVLAVYDRNRSVDPETLELKLDEVVLRETSRLERFIWIVKVVSVVAPLLGLLGTVTGMIQTFQAITLFGAGDPKMMASGISEALVTTMLGLIAAIPLVLLHATLANSTRRITDTLDAQSAGLIALRSESVHDGL